VSRRRGEAGRVELLVAHPQDIPRRFGEQRAAPEQPGPICLAVRARREGPAGREIR
jgi:hypothetical protein